MWFGHLRESQPPLFYVLGEEVHDLVARAAHHNVLEHLLAHLLGHSLDGLRVFRATPAKFGFRRFDAFRPFLEKGFQVTHAGDRASPGQLEQLQLCEDVLDGVVQRRRRDQNHFAPPTDLVQLGIALRALVAETVSFVDENIVEAAQIHLADGVQLAHRFHDRAADAELEESFPPVVFQHRGADDQFASRQLLRQHGGDIGLAQADHVRQKDAPVGLQDLFGRSHRLPLVSQVQKPFRHVNITVLVDVDVFHEIFVQEFEIQVVRPDLVVEPGMSLNSFHVGLGNIDCFPP